MCVWRMSVEEGTCGTRVAARLMARAAGTLTTLCGNAASASKGGTHSVAHSPSRAADACLLPASWAAVRARARARSGQLVEGAVAAGLASEGADVTLVGLATTPCMFYTLVHQRERAAQGCCLVCV